ncbi:DUF4124 domain-containing protein [Litoribrevibacter albus]|uniref:DUF4124 domain-containing protein n=1 Tax=Litoribrevibacter albus TaxID=1473156 RepID=A0AA37SCV5_9GAMM|nr:DUF4124 domain-containing protein [Litoribrevibacter albus]GLQ33114.1 hypothetical protein GCM10007876_35930 [Litoribrevibacter albus]
MKIMIKLMLLALVGAVVAPMLIKGPDGKPLLSWQDFFSLPSQDSGSASSSDPDVTPQSPSGLTTVYKWKDKEGQWHFSDKPQDHVDNETLKYNPNANIIQSLAKKEEESEVEVTPMKVPEPSAGPSLTTVPLTEVPELMDQAKQYQQLLDQRNKTLEQFNANKK